MEFKGGDHWPSSLYVCKRINRNIMEFKGEQDRSCLGKYKELIET